MLAGDEDNMCTGSTLGNIYIDETISEVNSEYGEPDYSDESNNITTYIYYEPNGVKELMISFVDGYVVKVTVQIAD